MRIKYRIYEGKAYPTELVKLEDGSLQLEFDEVGGGNVMIGARVFPVKKGACTIPVRKLDEGEIVPRLVTDTFTVTLDRFKIHAGIAEPCDTYGAYARISAELVKLMIKFRALDETVSRMSELILKERIF